MEPENDSHTNDDRYESHFMHAFSLFLFQSPLFLHTDHPRATHQQDFVLGHEFVGHIAELGSRVKVRDTVFVLTTQGLLGHECGRSRHGAK